MSLVEVTPRTRIRDRLQAEPPEWLTDRLIIDWGLLDRPAPAGVAPDWPTTIATWLLPEIGGVASLEDWLTVVAAAEGFPRRSVRARLAIGFATRSRMSRPIAGCPVS